MLFGAIFDKRISPGFVLHGILLLHVALQGLFINQCVPAVQSVYTAKPLGRQKTPHSLPQQDHHQEDDDTLQAVEDIRHKPGDIKA